jgi:hypothetical protein
MTLEKLSHHLSKDSVSEEVFFTDLFSFLHFLFLGNAARPPVAASSDTMTPCATSDNMLNQGFFLATYRQKAIQFFFQAIK